MISTNNTIPFGIPFLDTNIGGMLRGFVTAIYATTSCYKTATALHIARNAVIAWHNVVFFGEDDELSALNLKYVHLKCGMTPSDLLSQLRGIPIDLVVVDNVYFMKPSCKFLNVSEKVNCLYQELHKIARKQNVSLLVTDQLARRGIFPSPFATMHCETVITLEDDALKMNIMKTRQLCYLRKGSVNIFE